MKILDDVTESSARATQNGAGEEEVCRCGRGAADAIEGARLTRQGNMPVETEALLVNQAKADPRALGRKRDTMGPFPGGESDVPRFLFRAHVAERRLV